MGYLAKTIHIMVMVSLKNFSSRTLKFQTIILGIQLPGCLISQTAGYATCISVGVGGESLMALPIPIGVTLASTSL